MCVGESWVGCCGGGEGPGGGGGGGRGGEEKQYLNPFFYNARPFPDCVVHNEGNASDGPVMPRGYRPACVRPFPPPGLMVPGAVPTPVPSPASFASFGVHVRGGMAWENAVKRGSLAGIWASRLSCAASHGMCC